MIRRRVFAPLIIVAILVGRPLSAQARPQAPERAIRRDIPLTNMIRRAFAAGTRDSTGRPGRNYWQLWMDYTIAARLDPATSTLSGRETIKLHNASDSALSSIQMRLDQNIFRPDVPRGTSVPAENHEGFVITRLAVNGADIEMNAAPTGRSPRGATGSAPFVSGLHTTSARIGLASPIAPKTTATIDVEWHYRLAGGAGSGHRMTYRWGDTLYQVAQWYPRVAVYDDLRGWDTDPYLGPSEFYNNFGRFDVTLDVPAGWIIGATGVLRNPQDVLTPTARERLSHVLDSDSTRVIVGPAESGPGRSTVNGDRLTWHFVADTVNDFAWATAKSFVWEATRATIPGRGAIPVNIYHLPGRAPQFARSGPILRHALEFYSALWIPDAFPQHTMVDGPDNGMEYPMLVMSNDGPADHETGHQWWPMTVSNNETWYGWMDEGFNQYMNILSGADAAHRPPNLDGLGQSYGNVSGDEHEAPLMWDANYGGPLYGFQAYSKTPLMLSMLGGIVGDSAVWRAHREYAKAWRFKHPSPWDYAFFMSNALRQDLGWFWYYWLFTTESVDGSIEKVVTNGSHTLVTVREDGQMPSPVVLRVVLAASGPAIKPMPNSVVAGDTATVTYPVDVWFAGSKTFTADLDFGGRSIEQITLDPHCRFPDRNPSDNVWPRKTATPSAPGSARGGAACAS
ncbi:MAG: M1 family metallopeptidase [Deltaproteobacteria bacterium]